jgi:two-component system sensor histidine kinase BarA
MPKEIRIEDVILKRILMNLLNNACKFTPSKQSITLSVLYDKEGKKIKVSVTDTGIGIAKEKQDEIFKAFTQAEEDTKLNYGGTGLGLAICAEYVKELGGKLKLKSELDKGSSFYFTLPIDVTDSKSMLPPVSEKYFHIGICLDKNNLLSSKNLTHYLLRMGVKKEQIKAIKNNGISHENITHIICFQNQMNEKMIASAKEKKIPLLVVEEKFMSLLGREHEDFSIISQYGCYADTLHKFLTDTRPIRVLVADDDKINIALIKAILQDEYCQVDTAMDGESALKSLKNAIQEGYPYTMVYLDKYMPILSGPEVINTFRLYEKKKNAKRIFAISISGDDSKEDKGGSMFDMYVGKPFNKSAIKETMELAKACTS